MDAEAISTINIINFIKKIKSAEFSQVLSLAGSLGGMIAYGFHWI